MARDPKIDPRKGDVVESYDSFLDHTTLRTVISINGCRITFSIGGNLYSCCLDIWKILNKTGKVISRV